MVLGRGGFGKVMVVKDTALGRTLAMKRLSSSLAQSDKRAQAEARLLREARVIGQLEHPAIVPLHDIGRTPEGRLFYTMRRIRGRTLAEAAAATRSLAERLRLLPHVLAACHAVAHAHSRGVLHRDLKPQNVMVDRFGETYVIDWGLAATRDTSSSLPEPTDLGELELVDHGHTLSDGKGRVGTPAYMSPEQLSGRRELIDERSDVWGLGAILYECLTGAAPRESGPLARHPGPVREAQPDCPADLAALCDKALAQARDARYATAEALAADLDAWLHGRQVTAHSYRAGELLRRFARENRLTLAVAGVGLVLLASLGGAAFARLTEERNRARAFALWTLDEVLPRLTNVSDPAFVTGFTAHVQDWLEAAGADVEDDAIAMTWRRLALNAEARGSDAESLRFAARCLRLVPGIADPFVREAAELTCGMVRDSANALGLDESWRRLQRLWDRPLPEGGEANKVLVEARARVANRVFYYASNASDAEHEERFALESVRWARRWHELAPGDPTSTQQLSAAHLATTLSASNSGHGQTAVSEAQRAVALAREAMKSLRDESSLAHLSEALHFEVSQRQWHQLGDDATLERLRAEADAALAARLLMAPDSLPAQMAWLDYVREVGDGARGAELASAIDPTGLNEPDTARWLHAMLLAGKSAVLLERRALCEPMQLFDVHLALGLALLEQGDARAAAAALRRATRFQPFSVFAVRGFGTWAAGLVGPGADEARRFVADLSRAYVRSDSEGILRATRALADALDGLTVGR